MRRLAVLVMVLSCFAVAQDKPKFTVHKLEQPKVEAIAKADAEMVDAAAAFYKAQLVLNEAKQKRDDTVKDAIKQYNPVEGSCIYPSGVSWGDYYPLSTRTFTRVEIRGEYILITSGTETCGSSWAIQNTSR